MNHAIYSFYVGTYADSAQPGLYRMQLDPERGELRVLAGYAGLANPSFIVPSREKGRLFAVSETEDGHVAALTYDEAHARFALLGKQPTLGADPCHLQLDPTGNYLAVANYNGGNVALFPIGGDGLLRPASDNAIHRGSSVNLERQEAPHPHSVFVDPAGELMLAADLGTDKIALYRIDREAGKLIAAGAIAADPGAGPRHLAFHPTLPVLYCINELDSTIGVYPYPASSDQGRILVQKVDTLPGDFVGTNTTADIHVHPNGRFLYASNRGHDSLAIFGVNAEDGTLEPRGHVPSGRTPRNFCLTQDGAYLLAANQDSDSIRAYRIEENGGLTEVCSLHSIAKPVCIRNV